MSMQLTLWTGSSVLGQLFVPNKQYFVRIRCTCSKISLLRISKIFGVWSGQPDAIVPVFQITVYLHKRFYCHGYKQYIQQYVYTQQKSNSDTAKTMDVRSTVPRPDFRMATRRVANIVSMYIYLSVTGHLPVSLNSCFPDKLGYAFRRC